MSVGALSPFNGYDGYTAFAQLDTTDGTRFQPDCDDIRVVYWDGSGNIELDRQIFNCGSSATEIWFALQADMPANSSSTDYFVYYGNSAAGSGPQNLLNIYLWVDDFSTDPFAVGSSRYTRTKAVDIHGDAYSLPTYDAINDRVVFDTGDNFTSDMYVDNGFFTNSEQDVLIQVDHFSDASYPSNATDAIVARVSALNTSSDHEYLHFSHGTYSPSPGCSIDSWVNGERNNLCGGVAPSQYWAFNLAETWAWSTFSSTHRFWWSPGVTYATSDPAGRPLVLSGSLSPAQPGYFGLAPAQSRGWWDNLLIRRYTEPEPSTVLGPEETYAPPQIVDPKVDTLFTDADGNGVPSPGDTLRYAFTVSNIGGSHAINTLFTDTPDPNTTLEIGSVSASQGTILGGNNPGDTTVTIQIGTIPPATTITISFRVTIDDPLTPGVDQISNQGLISGDNFPNTPTDDPATAAPDDPTVTLIARLSESLPSTGFAPDSGLSPQSTKPGVRYTRFDGMELQIPTIGLSLPVLGVPLGADGWDVSWLGMNAGYLEGTAFPTRPGNSALTGHVTLASGLAGPFARLDQLTWDDRIELRFGAWKYNYVVRSVNYVKPDDLRVLQHEDLDWLTLITCAAFDPAANNYRTRVVVRAVLIQVVPIAAPATQAR